MDTAQASLAAGDFITARNSALAAQGMLALLPDTTRNSSGGGSDGVTWDRIAIDKFVSVLTRLSNSHRGVQVSRVNLVPLPGERPSQIGVW